MNRKNFLTGSILILALINGIVLSAMESTLITQEQPTEIDIDLHTTYMSTALRKKILHSNELDVTFYTDYATDEDLMKWISFLSNSNVTKLLIIPINYKIDSNIIQRHSERGTNITDFSPIAKLTKLQSLSINDQPSLTNLSLIEPLKNLHTLKIYNCHELNYVYSISECTNLRKIYLMWLNNKTLTTLPDMSALKNLETLSISSLYYLKNISATNLPESLHCLSVDLCSKLETIDQMETLKKLHTLTVSRCEKIQISTLPENTQNIQIDLCDSITDLTCMKELKNPKSIIISRCKNLADTSTLSNPEITPEELAIVQCACSPKVKTSKKVIFAPKSLPILWPVWCSEEEEEEEEGEIQQKHNTQKQ